MIEPVIIEQKIKDLENKPWTPIVLTRVNDQVVRLALFKGEYHWHKHDNEDELFMVYKGSIEIKIKNQKDVQVNEGEFIVIPKGVEHCPVSKDKAYVLLFEPEKLTSKGN